jgi:hypothetical protein
VVSYPGPRETTNKVLAQVEEGLLDKDYLINACLGALSEAEVHQMCLANDILLDELEDDDED